MQNHNLKAGNIDVFYENGSLRYFKINGYEILRMIYFTVRDANWGNFQSKISNEQFTIHANDFLIEYQADFEENTEVIVSWNVLIQGFDSDKISFEIIGEAKQDFKTNRAGFCILHPIEGIAGEPLQIIHSNDTTENTLFPKYIAPFQPFFDIKTMKWQVADIECVLDFAGDIFECEDQRNWGDASYKTYCTPLALPFPKTVKKGEIIRQKTTFQALIHEARKPAAEMRVREKKAFNLGICANETDYPDNVIERIKNLNLSHLRTEIYFDNHWRKNFILKLNQLRSLEIPFEVNLNLSNNFENELDEFIAFTNENRLKLKYLTLLSRDEMVTNQAIIDYIPTLKKRINVKTGIGTNYNFTELNRFRFDAAHADFIQFAFDPQQHAVDDLTILENAQTITYMTDSAVQIYGLPVHISPIMLKRRYNPYATDEKAKIISIESQTDERQKTVFLAEWTEKLLQTLSESGVESVSYLETHGALGIMDKAGNPYKVYEVLKNFETTNS